MVKTKKEKTPSKKPLSAQGAKKKIVKAAKTKAAVKKTKPVAQAKVKKAAPSLRHKAEKIKEKPDIIAAPVVKTAAKPAEKIISVKPAAVPFKPAPKEEPKAHVEARKEIPPVKAAVPPKQELKKTEPQAVEVVLPPAPAPVALKEIELDLPISLKDLSIKLQEKPSVVIKFLLDSKVMAGINQMLDEPTVVKICDKYHFKIKKAQGAEELALGVHTQPDSLKVLQARPPIVTFMGHVDHGKTSLLDAIRNTKVVEREHGGITQHIGAYRVNLPHGEITFLDTPGHEAFTAMRARGASITDIVVLVVAADDGIMPQTEEAIDHARAAGVSIMVALNKMDKPQADPDRVKKQLQKLKLVPEDWGGKTITVAVSAKAGTGIDNLLEMILLEAQMLELKANPNRLARGVVVEAKMSKGRGPVATLLVQNGTLHLNDNIIVGNFYGKIRAMFNDRAQAVTSAGPAIPVEVLGIGGVPEAGEQFFALENEREAKELSRMRTEKDRLQQVKSIKRISLEDLHAQIKEGKIKDLKIIIKADVQGSLEAIKETLNKLNVSEIKLNIIHAGVGNINSSDVILAVASNALILGFNVTADERAKELVAKEGIDLKIYNIIYELANDIRAAIEGMLEPRTKKIFLGRAEIRKVFKLTKSGLVAGCFVNKGKFNRTGAVSIIRNGQVVFEGKLSALKRFKDDVRDVAEGFECGMSFAGFDQMQEGDTIEAYEIEKIARKL